MLTSIKYWYITVYLTSYSDNHMPSLWKTQPCLPCCVHQLYGGTGHGPDALKWVALVKQRNPQVQPTPTSLDSTPTTLFEAIRSLPAQVILCFYDYELRVIPARWGTGTAVKNMNAAMLSRYLVPRERRALGFWPWAWSCHCELFIAWRKHDSLL